MLQLHIIFPRGSKWGNYFFGIFTFNKMIIEFVVYTQKAIFNAMVFHFLLQPYIVDQQVIHPSSRVVSHSKEKRFPTPLFFRARCKWPLALGRGRAMLQTLMDGTAHGTGFVMLLFIFNSVNYYKNLPCV